MVEFNAVDVCPDDVFAILAKGESVRLMKDGTEFAVVWPSCGVGQQRAEFVEWATGKREDYHPERYEITKEEVDSWRDRTLGPEPLNFE